MSEFSDMSLNLSADDDDSNKVFYPELKTAEKTPEKKMGLRRKENFITSQERLTEELLTPLWKPRWRHDNYLIYSLTFFYHLKDNVMS